MPENKKPENTAFKQQRLKSWQPLLTPKSVIPSFFIVGLIFVPLGIVLHMASDKVFLTNKVIEARFDYTKCSELATQDFTVPTIDNGVKQWKFDQASQNCTIRFEVPADIPAPVFMYYRLTNFYQNNRKYVKSFDLKQLNGNDVTTPDAACDPLGKVGDANVNVKVDGQTVKVASDAVYYPCGLIANSMFSDSISDLACFSSDALFNGQACGPNILYRFGTKDIAWPADSSRYGESKYKTWANLTTRVVPPPFWKEAFPKYADGYTTQNFPNLKEDERFQVWMRTAGLPTFRKLWGSNKDNYLPKGVWEVTISQKFAVSKFGGTKSIVISNTSILGGKNSFLGAAYVVVGTLCVALGIAFLIRNMINPRKLGDHKLLSWNQQTHRPADQNALLGQGQS